MLPQDEALAKVKGLVAKKAIESWRKLPPRMKAYIDVEDMIQDGLMIVRHHIAHRYDSKKSALTTSVWWRLDNYYKNEAIYRQAQKRFDANDLPLEEVENVCSDEDDYNIEALSHVVKIFLKVYKNASEDLKESMKRWFLSESNTKIHLHGYRFKKDKEEFARLVKKYGLGADDCRAVMYSSICKAMVVKRLPENILIPLEVLENGKQQEVTRVRHLR